MNINYIKNRIIICQESKEDIKWASRWDYILDSMPHTRIHWFRLIAKYFLNCVHSQIVGKICSIPAIFPLGEV